jgi:hypothetical protein
MMQMGTGGTPACALYAPAGSGQVQWECGILCGMAGSANLGNCPTGLTCSGNLCQ